MGHNRLGTIPKSAKWRAVTEILAASTGAGPAENIAAVVAKTLDAAEAALETARTDPGLRFTFYLLTQIALAARHSDWDLRLRALGIRVDEHSTVFELTSQMQLVVDEYVRQHSHPTDISEIAQQAAGEAISSLARLQSMPLFEPGKDGLRTTIRGLSGKSGFSQLSQLFFGNFVSRFVNFYLSRVTASQVGGLRLADVDAVTEFNRALSAYCERGAGIIRDLCGTWYSKTASANGISIADTSRLVALVLKKLEREFVEQGGGR